MEQVVFALAALGVQLVVHIGLVLVGIGLCLVHSVSYPINGPNFVLGLHFLHQHLDLVLHLRYQNVLFVVSRMNLIVYVFQLLYLVQQVHV